jgi:hypothetical protein
MGFDPRTVQHVANSYIDYASLKDMRAIINSILDTDIDDMFTEFSFNYELVKINEHACRGLFYVTSVLSWGYLGNKENVHLRHNPEENYIRLAAIQRLTAVGD